MLYTRVYSLHGDSLEDPGIGPPDLPGAGWLDIQAGRNRRGGRRPERWLGAHPRDEPLLHQCAIPPRPSVALLPPYPSRCIPDPPRVATEERGANLGPAC